MTTNRRPNGRGEVVAREFDRIAGVAGVAAGVLSPLLYLGLGAWLLGYGRSTVRDRGSAA